MEEARSGGFARDTSPDPTVGIGLVAVGYLLGALGPCLILLARDLNVTRGELSWLSAGFGAALLLFGAAGPWALRWGAERALSAAAAGLGAGVTLLAIAASPLMAQIGALLLGVGGAGIALAAPVLLAGPDLAARLNRVNAAASVAAVSSPLFISAVDALTGRGRLALLVPVPGLAWLVATSARKPLAERRRGPLPPAATTAVGATRLFARVGRNWLCVVLAVAAEFAFLVWGAARLQDSGQHATAAVAAAAAFPIGMAAGRLGAVRFIDIARLANLGILLGVAGALAVAAPTGPVVATAALGVAGLGIAVLYPVTLGRLVQTPGLSPQRGAALGAAASGTAALSTPPLLGAIASASSLRTGFFAVALVLLLLFALEVTRRTDRPR